MQVEALQVIRSFFFFKKEVLVCRRCKQLQITPTQ